jgi:hypothetical protein
VETWAHADFLFRRIKEDGRFVKKPTGNNHEVSMAFVWMPETPVPIKEEDPGMPPPPKPKKGYKRARAPDSPEMPRVMTRRRAAQQGKAAMAEKGEEAVVKKEVRHAPTAWETWETNHTTSTASHSLGS